MAAIANWRRRLAVVLLAWSTCGVAAAASLVPLEQRALPPAPAGVQAMLALEGDLVAISPAGAVRLEAGTAGWRALETRGLPTAARIDAAAADADAGWLLLAGDGGQAADSVARLATGASGGLSLEVPSRLPVPLREATMARALGFLGKSCIHPSQVPVANAAFAPDAAELAAARRIVEAAAAQPPGTGAFKLDGRMIDAPFLKRAQALLAGAR